jgi:hypothetical protein
MAQPFHRQASFGGIGHGPQHLPWSYFAGYEDLLHKFPTFFKKTDAYMEGIGLEMTEFMLKDMPCFSEFGPSLSPRMSACGPETGLLRT